MGVVELYVGFVLELLQELEPLHLEVLVSVEVLADFDLAREQVDSF